ncbi:MAG: hypothetical protein ACLUHE_02655 [Christensenellales bacterium]
MDEQRQLDEIQSGEDKIERFMALVERYRDSRNIPMSAASSWKKVIVHETVEGRGRRRRPRD